MNYRRLGKAGTKVSEVALGSWLTFGSEVDPDTTRACVKTAVENGINFLDTADSYANGGAEKVLGQTIHDLGLRRQDLVISSKVYWPISDNINDQGLSRKHIMESIDNSLERLQTDYLDIYFCHRYDTETPLEEVVRAMDDLVHRGKILYWATSVWESDQIEDAVELADDLMAYRPQVEQPRYNMLDRHIETEIMPTCAKHGIGLTVWSPLEQGILTGKYNEGIPEGSRAARRDSVRGKLTEENVEKVRRLTKIADGLGIEMAQLALAWILRRPEISSVITGATDPDHVRSNAEASEVSLDDDVLAQIEEILANDPT